VPTGFLARTGFDPALPLTAVIKTAGADGHRGQQKTKLLISVMVAAVLNRTISPVRLLPD